MTLRIVTTSEDLAPVAAHAVITHLMDVYKDKLPDQEISPFDLGVLVGRQQVINHSKRKYKYPH